LTIYLLTKEYIAGTPMGNLANKKITVSEYFEIERNSLEKHEYYEGELLAMAILEMVIRSEY
jgi:Uma2 family endonuclease